MASAAVTKQIVREVAEDLQTVKGRTILALVGVAIGTAAVIAMLHIGHNARNAALRQFEILGTDLVLIQPQSTDVSTPHLEPEAVLALPEKGAGIAAAAPLIQASAIIRTGHFQTPAAVVAATDNFYKIAGAKLREGRYSSQLDGFSPFAVVGAGILKGLALPEGAALGNKVALNSQVFTIIGVLEETAPNPILAIDLNQSVVLPYAAARRVSNTLDITSIVARLSPGADDIKASEAVTRYFQSAMSSGTVVVQTARQLITSINEQMRIYALVLMGTGTISLLVGGVGIMNVMLMGVMERRQEIGLRQALGARRKDIRLMFLCETLLLAVIGSAVGTAGGYLAGWMFAQGSGWEFEPAALALPLGAGMALVVGLFFGIYPAQRAAGLDPITALRSE